MLRIEEDSELMHLKGYLLIEHFLRQSDQTSIDPSPLRPHTTKAIERVNTAARAAHPKVKIIEISMQLWL